MSNERKNPLSRSLLSTPLARQLSRRKLLQTTIAIGGVIGASALLAACGDDDSTPAATNTPGAAADQSTTAPDAATEAPDAATEPAAGGEPVQGGTLRIAVEQNPNSLDPAFVRDVGSTRGAWYLYDSLLDRDENDEVITWLADNWEVSAEGTEYTIGLKDGIAFHDGTLLDSEAVKYSFERLGDPELQSLYVDDYQRYFDTVTAVDERTVHITTPTFYSGFVGDYLANYAGHIVSPTAAQAAGADFAQNPVGTGPFKFSAYEPDSAVTYVRNEDYWAGAPHIETLIVRIIPEQGVQIVELEAGNIDVSFSVQAKDVDRLESANVEVFNAPPPTATWVAMNVAKGVTQEYAVRRAISLAMDREAVVSELLRGFGELSYGGTPKDWPRYSEEFQPDPFDLEEAGRILDEAGWTMGSGGFREKDGQVLKVNVLSTQLERALSYGLMNQFIQQQLTEVGFDTEIQTQEWGAYLDEFRAGTWWEVSFHAQNAQTRDTVGGALDPDAYWNTNQHAKATVPELAESADKMREIYRRMDGEVDPAKRIETWHEVQRLAAEQQLIGWLVHWDMLVGHQPRVKGLIIKPVMADTLHKVHEAWIQG